MCGTGVKLKKKEKKSQATDQKIHKKRNKGCETEKEQQTII